MLLSALSLETPGDGFIVNQTSAAIQLSNFPQGQIIFNLWLQFCPKCSDKHGPESQHYQNTSCFVFFSERLRHLCLLSQGKTQRLWGQILLSCMPLFGNCAKTSFYTIVCLCAPSLSFQWSAGHTCVWLQFLTGHEEHLQARLGSRHRRLFCLRYRFWHGRSRQMSATFTRIN